MATAASDLGHEKSASFFPDGLWAHGNPDAIVDFAYAGMHKTTLLAKALVKTYYGQSPKYSYYSGCSDGGREGLQEVQRFPEDFDGVVVGAPVIDEVATNTFYHAWGVRTNSQPDGSPILTANKMPALVAAVIKACGDAQGLIVDPRVCKFDLSTITCKSGADDDSCLSPAQAEVVRKLWSGPVDAEGNHLSAGDMPIGSEAALARDDGPEGSRAEDVSGDCRRLPVVFRLPELHGPIRRAERDHQPDHEVRQGELRAIECFVGAL